MREHILQLKKTRKESTYAWWLDPVLFAQLEHAFKIGCTDDQACLYAGITTNQLDYYCKNINTEYRARKEMLKQMPVIHSRQTVANSVKVDPSDAFKYLERRQKDEFAPVRELGGLFDPDVGSVKITIVTNEKGTGDKGNSSPEQEPSSTDSTGG